MTPVGPSPLLLPGQDPLLSLLLSRCWGLPSSPQKFLSSFALPELFPPTHNTSKALLAGVGSSVRS